MTLSLSAGLLLGMAASLILTPACYAVLGKAWGYVIMEACSLLDQYLSEVFENLKYKRS